MKHNLIQPYAPETPLTVIFDGDCGICNALRRQVEARDRGDQLRFVAFQSADLYSAAPDISREMAQRSVCVVHPDGRCWKGARAIFEILRHLPGVWRWIGTVGALPLISLLAEPFYRLVARYRGTISHWLGLSWCTLDNPGNERVIHEP